MLCLAQTQHLPSPPENTIPTVKHGGGRSCCGYVFHLQGLGNLSEFEGIMKGAKCREIHERNLFQSPRDWRLGQRFTFLQDNDPKHTAKATLEWFKGKHLNVLEWPSQYPDVNPIENLWYDLKIAVHQRNPSNLKELEKFGLEERENIQVDRCAKLIETRDLQL